MFVDRQSPKTNQVVLSSTSEDVCSKSLVGIVHNVDILDNEFDFFLSCLCCAYQPSSGVKGRLKENIDFWKQIKEAP